MTRAMNLRLSEEDRALAEELKQRFKVKSRSALIRALFHKEKQNDGHVYEVLPCEVALSRAAPKEERRGEEATAIQRSDAPNSLRGDSLPALRAPLPEPHQPASDHNEAEALAELHEEFTPQAFSPWPYLKRARPIRPALEGYAERIVAACMVLVAVYGQSPTAQLLDRFSGWVKPSPHARPQVEEEGWAFVAELLEEEVEAPSGLYLRLIEESSPLRL